MLGLPSAVIDAYIHIDIIMVIAIIMELLPYEVYSMIHEATAMVVRKNLGELLNGVQYRHDSVVITKAGKPIAALVDMEFFEKIRQMKNHFERLSTELAQAYRGVDAKLAASEIAEAIRKTRKEK